MLIKLAYMEQAIYRLYQHFTCTLATLYLQCRFSNQLPKQKKNNAYIISNNAYSMLINIYSAYLPDFFACLTWNSISCKGSTKLIIDTLQIWKVCNVHLIFFISGKMHTCKCKKKCIHFVLLHFLSNCKIIQFCIELQRNATHKEI